MDDTAERRLLELHQRVAGRFRRAEPRRRARSYVAGLLSTTGPKNGWTLAQHAGEASPDGMQRLLRNADWDADGVRDDIRDFVVERLDAGRDGALGTVVVGEAEFVKRGSRSVGVERQFARRLQRIENCQIGLFCGYVTPRGRGLIDRELYLPPSWAADPPRRRAAGVPDDVPGETRSGLARRMIERAIDSGVPAGYVVSLEPYGRDAALRHELERRGVAYVLGIDRPGLVDNDQVRDVEEDPANLWPSYFTPSPSAHRDGLGCGVLTCVADRTARFACAVRPGTTLGDLMRCVVAAAGFHQSLEVARERAGLGQYQLRSWHGWYRHVTLALLASAVMD